MGITAAMRFCEWAKPEANGVLNCCAYIVTVNGLRGAVYQQYTYGVTLTLMVLEWGIYYNNSLCII